jgi:serine/threonine protein kinase
LLGEVFDRRFRVEARIAAGGFGAIYRATHLKSGHQFALKVLHPNLTSAPDVVARFRREGAALTLLRDPHTITAYELGEADDGTLYIVMELLRGESLYERYRAQGPMPWESVVAIARAVCSSLAEAHALGIIHRDLKPTNIHLEPRGNERDFVKVLDFGIAKILHDSDIDSSDLTQAGQMIGTLDYMSPEQMVGGMCDASSDIYTLGIVMYEMIAGCKPFDDANSAAAALAAVLTTTPPRLATRAVVTPDVDQVVMRCLERQHTDRFQSAVELATALDEILPEVEEAVTRVATGVASPIPGGPNGVTSFASTLQGVASVVSGPPKRTPKNPAFLSGTPKPVPATPKPAVVAPKPAVAAPKPAVATPKPAVVAPKPPVVAPKPPVVAPRPPVIASTPDPAIAETLPFTPLEPISEMDLADPMLEPGPDMEPAASRTETDRDMKVAVAKTEPMIPKLKSPSRPGGIPVRGSAPKIAPSSMPVVFAPDTTLLGPSGPERTAPPGRSQPITPYVPGQNLREAYPTIHQVPPSPSRPPLSSPGDRPASASTIARFDMARTMRREAIVRRIALAISLVIAAVVAFLIASRI